MCINKHRGSIIKWRWSPTKRYFVRIVFVVLSFEPSNSYFNTPFEKFWATLVFYSPQSHNLGIEVASDFMAKLVFDNTKAPFVVSRYMSNPGWKHWEAIKHILRYLRGTKDARLTFGSNNSTEVEGYTDSDYAGNTDNRKSTSGYVFTYGGGAISSRSKLQECTTMSTTEAEFIAASEAASEATKEAIWQQRLMADFSIKRWIIQITLTLPWDSQITIHLM